MTVHKINALWRTILQIKCVLAESTKSFSFQRYSTFFAETARFFCSLPKLNITSGMKYAGVSRLTWKKFIDTAALSSFLIKGSHALDHLTPSAMTPACCEFAVLRNCLPVIKHAGKARKHMYINIQSISWYETGYRIRFQTPYYGTTVDFSWF